MHKNRNAYTWTALIGGYTQKGQGQDAFKCFQEMQQQGLSPNALTYTCVLKACASIGAVEKGTELHGEIAKQGFLGHYMVLGNALVGMYAKCGSLAKAHQVLEELPVRDVISWNALITGYAEHGQGSQALNCFDRMQFEGLFPDAMTFSCVLKACGSIMAINIGEKVYKEVVKQGLIEDNVVLGNALVGMYSKCGFLTKARRVLKYLAVRNAISWNALIVGYVEEGKAAEALNCFEEMQYDGVSPDPITYACALKACGRVGAVVMGEKIHEEVTMLGLLENDIVLGNALVAMYSKCGALGKAQALLMELPIQNVATWNALIAGYIEHGENTKVLSCLEQMQQKGLDPNAVTFACCLKACGGLTAVGKGVQLHDQIAKQGLLAEDGVLRFALVDMYAKCGFLTKAQEVLEENHASDVMAWTSLIGGLIEQGEGAQALLCFERMQQQGLSPDAATFSCVLTACSRLGLVQNAQDIFAIIGAKQCVNPDLRHYTCMVDVFGRAGQLDKAVQVIEKLPLRVGEVWYALLGACLKWGDVNVSRWAFERVTQLGQNDPTIYALMTNIHAAAVMEQAAVNF